MGAPKEIIFEVTEAVEGGFDARALGHSIFTQGEDWVDLKSMVKDAVLCHFGDEHETMVGQVAFRQGRSHGGVRLPRDMSGEDLAALLHHAG